MHQFHEPQHSPAKPRSPDDGDEKPAASVPPATTSGQESPLGEQETSGDMVLGVTTSGQETWHGARSYH